MEGSSASSPRAQRLAAAAGAPSACLLLAGIVLQGLAFDGAGDESSAEVVARYSDGGNELLAHVGALVAGFGVALALPFLAALRDALRFQTREQGVVATAASAGGLLMVAMTAASMAVTEAAFSSYDAYDAYETDASTVLLMQSVSFYALGFALVGGAVLAGSTSIVAMKTRLLPKWLAVAGLVLAAVCLFGSWALIVFVPLPLLLVWVLVVAVLLARSATPRLETRAPAPHNPGTGDG
jgi:hypothetical protein